MLLSIALYRHSRFTFTAIGPYSFVCMSCIALFIFISAGWHLAPVVCILKGYAVAVAVCNLADVHVQLMNMHCTPRLYALQDVNQQSPVPMKQDCIRDAAAVLLHGA